MFPLLRRQARPTSVTNRCLGGVDNRRPTASPRFGGGELQHPRVVKKASQHTVKKDEWEIIWGLGSVSGTLELMCGKLRGEEMSPVDGAVTHQTSGAAAGADPTAMTL